MSSFSSHRKLFILLGVSLVVGLVFEYFGGFPQFIEGRIVTRKTRWMSVSPILNLPLLQEKIYYAYQDENGQEIKHGPFRIFDRWCPGFYRVCYSYGSYLDGLKENTWLSTDGNGQKLKETFYRDGEIIGNADYQAGELASYHRFLYEHGYRIGKMDYIKLPSQVNGLWTFTLTCNGRQIVHQSLQPDSAYQKCSLQ